MGRDELNSDFELPASIFLCGFAAALVLYKVSPAWPFRTHGATSLMAPTCQLRIGNVPFESEKKEKRFKDEN